jgi:beta-lactamase regulating signal transducer with metallopeptidase domain
MTWWLFQNVVVTAGLALVVVVICRTTRIGPVGRHALWLVVLIKFVTPPLVVWPWAAPDPWRLAAIDARLDETGAMPPELLVPAPDRNQLDDDEPPAIGADVAGPAVPSMTDSLAAVWPWLLAIWIAGSIGLLGLETVRLVRLSRRVRAGRDADPAIVARVARLSAQLGVRPVAVRAVAGSAPPAVWCAGRPQILWPDDLPAETSDVSVDGLLLHELAHVKRRDHLVGWIELAAGIVWWWHPLFWYVRSALREQAELACDAWVISTLPHGRRAYAESLLTLSSALPRGQLSNSMAVVGIRASNRRVLERRLAMIMQGRARLRLTRIGLVCLALLAAGTLPGWAAAQDPPPPPPPPPVEIPPPVDIPPPPPPAPAPGMVPVLPPAPPSDAPPLPTSRPAPDVPVLAPQDPPPPPRRRVIVPPNLAPALRGNLTVTLSGQNLPGEGQALLERYQADREAILRKVEQEVEARRQVLRDELQALQDQHTKAGRLDEAVAIRDFLRADMPGTSFGYVLRGGRGAAGSGGGRGGRGRGGVR